MCLKFLHTFGWITREKFTEFGISKKQKEILKERYKVFFFCRTGKTNIMCILYLSFRYAFIQCITN